MMVIECSRQAPTRRMALILDQAAKAKSGQRGQRNHNHVPTIGFISPVPTRKANDVDQMQLAGNPNKNVIDTLFVTDNAGKQGGQKAMMMLH